MLFNIDIKVVTTLPYIMHKLALGFALLVTPVALFCLIMWLWTSPGWRLTFATIKQHYRKLTPMGRFIVIALLAVFLVKGSTKSNSQGFSPPPPTNCSTTKSRFTSPRTATRRNSPNSTTTLHQPILTTITTMAQ